MVSCQNAPNNWSISLTNYNKGVRNPVARNHMRAMRAGDLAFFYHSNCKTPGVAGVMRIVGEHEVDESAFNPNHPYYDAKSDREKPKWELVRVEFVKKFSGLVTLKELRSYSLPGSALQHMVMLKQSRLSVSPVTPAEWTFILECAGEKPSLGHPTPRDGYETDVDGEGEAVADKEETLKVNGDNTKDQALSQHNGHAVADKRQIMEGTIAFAGDDDTEEEDADGGKKMEEINQPGDETEADDKGDPADIEHTAKITNGHTIAASEE